VNVVLFPFVLTAVHGLGGVFPPVNWRAIGGGFSETSFFSGGIESKPQALKRGWFLTALTARLNVVPFPFVLTARVNVVLFPLYPSRNLP
jgi:hypothetical protein